MQNPFSISFGKEPLQFISRITESEEIVQAYESENPPTQVYMVTGVRGSGKTVLLTEIGRKMEEMDEWIVVALNPARDLLESLAAKLYRIPKLHRLFLEAKFDFSLFGLGASVENVPPVADIESVLELMFEKIRKAKKKVLITIDEVVPGEQIRIFANTFQILLRENAPVYLIMTGLYDNIYDIQNEDTLTFLYRAPKIILRPLSLTAIKNKYVSVLQVPEEVAIRMAKLTKGYAFAFQVLGYLYWKCKAGNAQEKALPDHDGNLEENLSDHDRYLDEILPDFDQYLEEYVYEKIWMEMSEQDKQITAMLSCDEYMRVQDVREKLNMSSGLFSIYRQRLIRKGLVDVSRHGYLALALPRFDAFMKVYAE